MGRSRKDPHSPKEEISAIQRGKEKNLFLIIVSVLGQGGSGVNFQFLPWGR
jgi:hypothetical protein